VIDAAVEHGVSLTIVHLSDEEFDREAHSFLENVRAEGIQI
jgi:hypothetical protein